MQVWPALRKRERGAHHRGPLHVGVAEHDEDVRAAEFEQALLHRRAGQGGDPRAGGRASRDGDEADARIDDHPLRLRHVHQERGEGSGREARRLHHPLQRQAAAADVRSVLQEHGVTGHQARDHEAQHLPHGQVPGGDQHDRTERLEHHLAGLGRAAGRRLLGKLRGADLGVVAAALRRLVDLHRRLGERPAHLGGDGGGEALPLRQEPRAEPPQPLRPPLGPERLQLRRGDARPHDGPLDRLVGEDVEACDLVLGRRIDRHEGLRLHGRARPQAGGGHRHGAPLVLSACKLTA